MSTTNEVSEEREIEVVFINGNHLGYDPDFCFHIKDFKVGDAIEFTSDGKRKRGVVTKVTNADLRVYFTNTDRMISSCHLNEITYLAENTRGWLSAK
jgi:hypothetical protein